MISQTGKENWIREAATRLTSPKQRKTISDDIEAITAGVKFLMTNPEAERLAHAVLDVAFERMGILLSNMYENAEDKATIKQVADELKINILTKCVFRNQGNCCEECFDKKAVLKMANRKDEQTMQKDEDIDWKTVYDAEVVRHAELIVELDALKNKYAKAQQQLAEYRQTLAELSNTNSKLVKDIAALSGCKGNTGIPTSK